MISLYERLDQAFKEAIKNQQPVATSTLRLLKSAIRYREVDVRRPLTEAELQATLNTQVKQRREAIAEYTKAGRPELACSAHGPPIRGHRQADWRHRSEPDGGLLRHHSRSRADACAPRRRSIPDGPG